MLAGLLLSVLFAAPAADVLPIHRVQGATHRSPLVGQEVAVEGIVTASHGDSRRNAYSVWIEAPVAARDARDETSEGLVVMTTSDVHRDLAVGDIVRARGVVEEQLFGDGTLPITTLVAASVETLEREVALPAPVRWGGEGGRTVPTAAIDDDGLTSFDIGTDSLDFLESCEGMRVQIADARATSARNKYGEVTVVCGGTAPLSARGALVMTESSAHPGRVTLDDLLAEVPEMHLGDRFTSDVIGVVHYSFGNYKVLVTNAPTVERQGLLREVSEVPDDEALVRVATFNVENLDARDDPEHFARLAALVVDNLRSPDLIGVQEIQDDDGPECGAGTTSAAATWALLIDAIVAAGGPRYSWADVAPVDGEDGGQPCGNIRVGFLWRTDTGLSLARRPGSGPTDEVAVLSRPDGPTLSFSPGRFGTDDASFDNSRKPLIAQFRRGGESLFAIVAHLRSKGGDDSLYGTNQPPVRHSEPKRVQQAAAIGRVVDALLEIDEDAAVIVMGDLNDFPFSRPVRTLAGTRLVSLIEQLPENERYTYVYQGVAQVLDHVLVSKSLFGDGSAVAVDVVHVNAEFADQVSDHDPVVVGVPFP